MARPAIFSQSGAFDRAALAALIAFLLTGTLYLATMSRTYGFIDRGELAAVATTLGIAHPTRYPTITLLGHAAVRLFPSVRPLLVLNVLSALWTATGVALAMLVIHKVLRSTSAASSIHSLYASFFGPCSSAFSHMVESGNPSRFAAVPERRLRSGTP